jgi:Glycosyltransferase like family 2
MPLLSIVIPARLRPGLLRDAILSTLNQDYGDFELLVSNNGADADVRAAVSPFLADPRIRYVEQRDILDMVTHWEQVTREIQGEYLLVLTDRSAFKQGAFRRIATTLQDTKADAVSWPWDLYYEKLKLHWPHKVNLGRTRILDVEEELVRCANGLFREFFRTLPRGSNSCVSRALIERIRARQGQAFRPLYPDFSFAFSCLLNSNKAAYIAEPLFISQGIEVGNGNGLLGDARPYIDSLGLAEPLRDVPVKVPLVLNGIAQDFLAAVREYQRPDLAQRLNKAQYYLNCLYEIEEKRSKGLVSSTDLGNIELALHAAIASESKTVQDAVRRRHQSLWWLANHFINRPLRDRSGGPHPYLLRVRGARTCATVLAAGGFRPGQPEAPTPRSHALGRHASDTRAS